MTSAINHDAPPPAAPGETTPARALAGAVLLSLVAEELADAASAEQAAGFFRAIGRRMADLLAMADVNDLPAMEHRINGLWRALGLGAARLSALPDAIVVRHECEPDLAEQAAGWRVALPALLQGAYAAWFRELGGSDRLTTTAAWSGPVIELRHGL